MDANKTGWNFTVGFVQYYCNKEIQFQYIPGWIELNLKDIYDAIYQTSVAINMLSSVLPRFSKGQGAI